MEQSDLSTLSLYLYPSLFRRGSFVDVIVLSDFIDWAARFRRIGFGIGFSNNFVVLFVSLLWMDIYSRRSGRRIFFCFFLKKKKDFEFLSSRRIRNVKFGISKEASWGRVLGDRRICWLDVGLSFFSRGRKNRGWLINREMTSKWKSGNKNFFYKFFLLPNYELLERNINRNTFERIIV